jgi:hypothetical protein
VKAIDIRGSLYKSFESVEYIVEYIIESGRREKRESGNI